MIYYQRGSTQTIIKYQKPIRFLLLTYHGLFRDKHTKQITFKLSAPLPDGRDSCQYEVWECLNLETGMKDIKKFPVYMYSEEPSDELNKDREVTIDDNHEVTSLLDSYECWEDYRNTTPPNPKRDGKNFHLKIINRRHSQQLAKLRELDSDESLSSNYKRGVRLKLIQKETPNHLTRRDFNLWKQEFPQLFTKLQNDVYSYDSSVSNVTF